jgi:signal transduction histidine kinase
MSTVLVVDDHPQNRYLLQALLNGRGHEVLVAENGEAALELALQHPPSIVVSDVLMPVMDGFRLCRAWKRHPLLRDIPFVIYTATYTDPNDERLALSLGADAFIIRPAEPERLIAQIGELLSRRGAHGRAADAVDVTDDAYMRAYNAALIHKLEQKMAELEAANHRLQSSDARLRAIASASLDLICVLDQDGRFLEVLTPGTSLLPPADAAAPVGALTDLLSADDARRLREMLRRTLASGAVHEIEQSLALPGGERFFEARVAPLSAAIIGVPAVVLAARDVTRRRQAERQLQQAQKLDMIGQLTAGIAHDFNNLLTIINGNTDLLLEEAPPELRPPLEQVARAGAQAAGLTRQLLAFSRKQVLQPVVTDLNAVVRGLEQLLRRAIGDKVRLGTTLDPRLGKVLVDPVQIEQVLLNLALNARDAMPDGGSLLISTANASPDGGATLASPPARAAAEYVALVVSDSGHGMSAEVQAQIFEPFFTTKESGVGTGLGLSVVYGIVAQSGGQITVTSAPGAGTTMHIYLPRSEAAGVDDEPALPSQRLGAAPHAK